MKLYLASKSPRRRALLKRVVDDFATLDCAFDERACEAAWREREPAAPGEALAGLLARGKAMAAWRVLQDALRAQTSSPAPRDSYLILCADTVVSLDGVIFGKGKDRATSIAMLRALSGRTHRVTTALCLIDAEGACSERSCVTEVRFARLSTHEIESYVDLAAPYDKAGAYGIQEEASCFVESIRGDFFNVVGLPLRETYLLLKGRLPLRLDADTD